MLNSSDITKKEKVKKMFLFKRKGIVRQYSTGDMIKSYQDMVFKSNLKNDSSQRKLVGQLEKLIYLITNYQKPTIPQVF